MGQKSTKVIKNPRISIGNIKQNLKIIKFNTTILKRTQTETKLLIIHII